MNHTARQRLLGSALIVGLLMVLAIVVTTSNTPAHANSAPDLEVGTPSVNYATLYTGNQFTLSVTVTNAGDGQSASTTLRYYRSTDATITTSDTEVGTDSVDVLAAAGTSEQSIGLTAPSTVGTYYYGACVNSVSGESDTSDNCSASVTITVSAAGICDRTQQVWDAIVAALPHASDCANVTDTYLSRIFYLDLESSGITALKSGDLQGLSRLAGLKLSRNSLSELPDDVFDDLVNLDTLYLDINHLSELSDGVFDNLTNLGYLNLGNNGLGELPAGVFDNLSKLEHLYLGFRWEHNIPDASVYPENTLDNLPAGVLGNLSKLGILSISDNNLSVLPDGVFTGLTDLSQVNLIGNPGATFTVTANLEQDGDAAIVVKVTEGAPFDMLVTLSAEGGTLSATTITVEGGSDSSEQITVTPTGEGGADITVNVDSAVFQNYAPHHTRGIQTGTGAALTLAQNSPATGEPTISGTAQVGQTLTASTSGIADADGLTNVSYSYQWLADDTDIDDATSSTYTVQSSDNGKVIRVRVTFTDDAGNDESLTSEGTASVVMGGL